MENDEEKAIQAIILGDSFMRTFMPLTIDHPKVLLPLCNVPMISYTLEFLANADVDEIIIFGVWKGDVLREFIRGSKWANSTRPKVRVVESTSTTNPGDAMRQLSEKGDSVITAENFVLVSGDVVSNVRLKPAIEGMYR